MDDFAVPAVTVLGGAAWPVGWSMGFVNAPYDLVVRRLVDWRTELEGRVKVAKLDLPWPACLSVLEPLEMPWTTELLVEHGEKWTAYLNNSADGGDPWPAASYVANELGVDWVVADHHPRVPVGHAITQLQVGGPAGEPPLMYIRVVSASAADGRWAWDASGTPLPFEQPECYTARRKRDRFTREMLVSYLLALGIHADDNGSYGRATRVGKQSRWSRKTRTLEQVRDEWRQG